MGSKKKKNDCVNVISYNWTVKTYNGFDEIGVTEEIWDKRDG